MVAATKVVRWSRDRQSSGPSGSAVEGCWGVPRVGAVEPALDCPGVDARPDTPAPTDGRRSGVTTAASVNGSEDRALLRQSGW